MYHFMCSVAKCYVLKFSISEFYMSVNATYHSVHSSELNIVEFYLYAMGL